MLGSTRTLKITDFKSEYLHWPKLDGPKHHSWVLLLAHWHIFHGTMNPTASLLTIINHDKPLFLIIIVFNHPFIGHYQPSLTIVCWHWTSCYWQWYSQHMVADDHHHSINKGLFTIYLVITTTGFPQKVISYRHGHSQKHERGYIPPSHW